MKSGSARVFEHQVPGGQYSNLLGMISLSLSLSPSLPVIINLFSQSCNSFSCDSYHQERGRAVSFSFYFIFNSLNLLSSSLLLSSPCLLPYANFVPLFSFRFPLSLSSLPLLLYTSTCSAMQVYGHPVEVGGSAGRVQGREQAFRRHHQGQLRPVSLLFFYAPHSIARSYPVLSYTTSYKGACYYSILSFFISLSGWYEGGCSAHNSPRADLN